MAFSRKAILALGVVGLVALISAWQGLSFWWKYAYSRGTRTGVIRKISVKGSPVCKYLAAELVLQGTVPGQPADVFEFSIDDKSDSNPLVKDLHDAERSGGRVTLTYRQDRKIWWRCNPAEYYVVKIER